MNTRRFKPENAIFAENLKYYIALSGKDQKQICSDLNIAETSMSEYVNAKSLPRLKTIQAIANYFGILIADLMGDGEKKEEKEKQKIHLKQWEDAFGGTTFTDTEFAELVNFANYLIAKRKD